MSDSNNSYYLVFYTYYHEDNHNQAIVNTNVRIANVWAKDPNDAETILLMELENIAQVVKVL